MPELSLALQELRDFVDGTRREIVILEQITRMLTSVVDLGDGPAADPLIRRHLVEIDRQKALAPARQTSNTSAAAERSTR